MASSSRTSVKVIHASEFGFGGGATGTDGSEEEEENDLELRISEILASVNLTTQKYLAVEAENSVLRAQVNELGCQVGVSERDHRLLKHHQWCFWAVGPLL
ncbi:bZIP transcription factor bZIP125 [Spatholobus suberectus]|nr:bZIP transcription factor bZIP125 [Spatholobus suberectus]